MRSAIFVLAAAAVLAATLPAAASAADAGAGAGAADLAGMRLDGLTAEGHAVSLEFAARQGSGDGARSVQPETLVLEGGFVRTASGPRTLGGGGTDGGGGGGGARVMVTGGGTIAVYSTDMPAVLLAVPAGPGGGYRVTAYVPRGDGSGGLETATFEAVLGPAAGGDAGGGGAGNAEDGADAGGEDGGGEGGDAGDPPRGDLVVAVTVTERIQYGGTLIIQGRVYDAALNTGPVAVVPRGPGAVPDVPVQVTVTDRRSGEAILDRTITADSSGLFRAEYGWRNTDPAAALGVLVSVDGGRAVEERTAFYQGP